MAHANPLNYRLLRDEEIHVPTWFAILSYDEALRWPGFPKSPSNSNQIKINIPEYVTPVKPIYPLGGRKTKRGVSYVSLSNYNNLP